MWKASPPAASAPAASSRTRSNWGLFCTGPAFTPKPLNVATSDDGVNSVLIAKSDGSYVHLIWRSWPDGKAHPIQWTYDRSMQVTAHEADGQMFTFPWTKAAGQPNDWLTYVEGVIVLELRPG